MPDGRVTAAGVGLLAAMAAMTNTRLGLAGLVALLSANTLAIAYVLLEV